MGYPNAKYGFTLLEMSIALLILSALTVIIYPVAQKRLIVSEIDSTVREAQMIADYGANIRTRWLASTSIDPATDKYSHLYNVTKTFYAGGGGSNYFTTDNLPFGTDQMLPLNNYTGRPYEISIMDDFAHVRTIIENTDPVLQIRILEQLQNHPLVVDSQNDPQGVVFIVLGRPSPSQIISQVGKAQFDKAIWYQEEIR